MTDDEQPEACEACGASVSYASRYRRGVGDMRTLFCSSACRTSAPPPLARGTEPLVGVRGLARWLLGALLLCVVGIAVAVASERLAVVTAAVQ